MNTMGHTSDWKNWPVSERTARLVTPGEDLGPLPLGNEHSNREEWLKMLTFGGMPVIGEGGLGRSYNSLLVDGLGRSFDAHIDRGVRCSSLDDRSRRSCNRCSEERKS